jgi:hypothetical protein
VLILEHILENPAGREGAILDEYETFYHLIHVGRDHLPDPTRYDAIVVLGGAVQLTVSRNTAELNGKLLIFFQHMHNTQPSCSKTFSVSVK